MIKNIFVFSILLIITSTASFNMIFNERIYKYEFQNIISKNENEKISPLLLKQYKKDLLYDEKEIINKETTYKKFKEIMSKDLKKNIKIEENNEILFKKIRKLRSKTKEDFSIKTIKLNDMLEEKNKKIEEEIEENRNIAFDYFSKKTEKERKKEIKKIKEKYGSIKSEAKNYQEFLNFITNTFGFKENISEDLELLRELNDLLDKNIEYDVGLTMAQLIDILSSGQIELVDEDIQKQK